MPVHPDDVEREIRDQLGAVETRVDPESWPINARGPRSINERMPADDEQPGPPTPPYARPDAFDRGEPPYPPLVGDTQRTTPAQRWAAARIDVPHDPQLMVGDPDAFAGVGGVARRYGLGAAVGDAIDPATPWGALGFATAELMAARFAELRAENLRLSADLEHIGRSSIFAAQQRAAALIERLIREHLGRDGGARSVHAGSNAHSVAFRDADGNTIECGIRCVRLAIPSRASVAELAGDVVVGE